MSGTCIIHTASSVSIAPRDAGFAGVAADRLNESRAFPSVQEAAAALTDARLAQSSKAATIPPAKPLTISKLKPLRVKPRWQCLSDAQQHRPSRAR